MPAVQHSPPLLGFDDERRAIDATSDPRSPENRSCSLRRGSISRGIRSPGRRPVSLTRGTSVSDPYHFDSDPDPRIRIRDDGSGSGSGSEVTFDSVNPKVILKLKMSSLLLYKCKD